MHPEYDQEGYAKRLAHVVEEAGEVIVAAGKIQRFGRFSGYNGEVNEDRLNEELEDLERAIKRLRQA